ncbi:hypothetical protein ACFLR4_03095 [Bacteroidota bacterium]
MKSGFSFFTFSMFLIFVILLTYSCSENPVESIDLLERIESLPGISVIEIAPTNNFESQFEINITQPLDHNNPNGTQFTQKLYLWHRDISAPVVLLPSGYTCEPPAYLNELTEALNANQLRIGHRFMAGAEPNPMDWQFLTEEQNANDVHRVVALFKDIYTGKWISTGGSKNGMTALFHKRFFPDDVDATVTLYTPMPTGTEDPRFDNFLNEVGTAEQRDALKDFQRMVLEMRLYILPRLRNFINNSEYNFSLSPEIILELEVCEFPFGFWQNFTFEEITLPPRGSTPDEVYNFMTNLWGWDYYSDEIIEFFSPVYCQAYTELGWYRLINDHLTDLLVADPAPSYSNYFTPPNVELNYDPSVMQNTISWLQSEGNNIIYIYGENDPWTAAAVELTGLTNALKIVQPEANHVLRISELDNPEIVYSSLENWLNIDIDWAVSVGIHSYNKDRFDDY